MEWDDTQALGSTSQTEPEAHASAGSADRPLVNLLVQADEAAALKAHGATLPSIQVDGATVDTLELLATGALSPLDRFMGQADCAAVLADLRLANGAFFPVPIILAAGGSTVQVGDELALRDPRNELLGVLRVDERFTWEPSHWNAPTDEAIGPAEGTVCLAGPVQMLQLPPRYDFRPLRLSPAETRARLAGAEVETWQVTRPSSSLIQRLRASKSPSATVLIQAVAPGGIGSRQDYFSLVRWCESAARQAATSALVSVVPLALPASLSRRALLQALVTRNYGATRLVIDGPFDPEAASLAESNLGLQIATAPNNGEQAVALDNQPRGACVWLTGLSGSGKSTTAEVLSVLAQERGRTVTLLDGDVVRTHLSSGLGFSRADRDTNIRRIGFVASEIVRHGGLVLCAAVSPYRGVRDEVRAMMPAGQFVEVFVNTPVEECERRDVKGMYAKARRGEITGFTGVDDPYEAPLAPELELETTTHTPEQNAWLVLDYLVSHGIVTGDATEETGGA